MAAGGSAGQGRRRGVGVTSGPVPRRREKSLLQPILDVDLVTPIEPLDGSGSGNRTATRATAPWDPMRGPVCSGPLGFGRQEPGPRVCRCPGYNEFVKRTLPVMLLGLLMVATLSSGQVAPPGMDGESLASARFATTQGAPAAGTTANRGLSSGISSTVNTETRCPRGRATGPGRTSGTSRTTVERFGSTVRRKGRPRLMSPGFCSARAREASWWRLSPRSTYRRRSSWDSERISRRVSGWHPAPLKGRASTVVIGIGGPPPQIRAFPGQYGGSGLNAQIRVRGNVAVVPVELLEFDVQ